MMNDYVSRKAAIAAINKALDRETLLNSFVRKIAVEAVKKMPSADVPRWIPCSEQMPTMNEYVLVCTVNGDITDGHRWNEEDDGAWFIFGDSHNASDGDIVAWMPLPEPYKEGEKNDNNTGTI